MKVKIGGVERIVKGGSSIDGLLLELGFEKKAVAVELNKKIVKKDRYGDTVLREGDCLEIVHLVGGG